MATEEEKDEKDEKEDIEGVERELSPDLDVVDKKLDKKEDGIDNNINHRLRIDKSFVTE